VVEAPQSVCLAQRGLLCPIRFGGRESWSVPLERHLHILEHFK